MKVANSSNVWDAALEQYKLRVFDDHCFVNRDRPLMLTPIKEAVVFDICRHPQDMKAGVSTR